LPEAHGIQVGEPTIAPWSVPSVGAARGLITGARSAAEGLLQRILTEANSQDLASGNDPNGNEPIGGHGLASVVDGVGQVRWWRNWLTYPRTALEAPAAIRMLMAQPGLFRSQLNPATWGIQSTHKAGAGLRTFTRGLDTPKWIRNFYQGASNLKLQNYVDPTFLHSTGLHASPTGARAPWSLDFLHSAKISGGLKSAMVGAGKGFSVLGAAAGVYNTVQGVNGMLDGDVTSGDVWQTADGVIGTVTSIGSLAPPPVGVAFAAVGLGYTAGRWLFGGDESGQTGIDKVGAVGESVVGGIADGAEAVGDFVDDVWPW